MLFINVSENSNHNWQWDSTVFNDAEEVGNGGNQIESKQPFYTGYTIPVQPKMNLPGQNLHVLKHTHITHMHTHTHTHTYTHTPHIHAL